MPTVLSLHVCLFFCVYTNFTFVYVLLFEKFACYGCFYVLEYNTLCIVDVGNGALVDFLSVNQTPMLKNK